MKLTGRWFPHIVDRDSGNLYPIYIKQKLWCLLLNLLAGDLGRPSCLVVSGFKFRLGIFVKWLMMHTFWWGLLTKWQLWLDLCVTVCNMFSRVL